MILKLTNEQARALRYILRNAHHIPLPNVTTPDVILPLSREILAMIDKQDDSLTPRVNSDEYYDDYQSIKDEVKGYADASESLRKYQDEQGERGEQ